MYKVEGINMLNAKVDNLVRMFNKLDNVSTISKVNVVLTLFL